MTREAYYTAVANVAKSLKYYYRSHYGFYGEDDLIQETLIALLENFGKYNHKCSIETWAISFLRNIKKNNSKYNYKHNPPFEFVQEETAYQTVWIDYDYQHLVTQLRKLNYRQKRMLTLIVKVKKIKKMEPYLKTIQNPKHAVYRFRQKLRQKLILSGDY